MFKSFFSIIDPITNKLHCWFCGRVQFCEVEELGTCACCDCSPHMNASLQIPERIS